MPVKTADSHRLLLRVPAPLMRKIREQAQKSGLSINSCIVKRLHDSFAKAAGFASSSTGPGVGPEELPLEKIRKVFGDAFVGVILFGSVARGEDNAASDTDLLIVVDESIAIGRSHYHELDEFLPPDGKISWQVAKIPEQVHLSSLWLEVALDGVVLWQRDTVLNTALSRMRRELLSRKLERRVAHGQGYWIVK